MQHQPHWSAVHARVRVFMIVLLLVTTGLAQTERFELFPVSVPAAGDPQTIWDFPRLSTAPETFPAEGKDLPRDAEIRPVFYAGESFRGRPTRVFAWIGVPAHGPGQKLPGMVLVHGGGGTAYRDWVRLWVARGYAAIAMDTCGAFLTSASSADADRHRNESSGPGGWGGFSAVNDPVSDQWMYHAVAAVIRGHSLLRSLPEVDSSRIGITGISWGGIITEVVAGVDSRFRFAAPVYGCGFLGENSFWLTSDMQKMGREQATRWLTLWDPSQYIGRTSIPMLFCNGTNDKHFRPDSWQKTYRTKPGPRTLSLKIRMRHGHAPAGDPIEITVYADSILRGGPPLPRVLGQGREKDRAWATCSTSVPLAKAEFLYTKDDGDWMVREWLVAPVPIGADSRVEATIPAGVTAYYFNLTDARGCIVSTEHEALK